MQFLLRQDMTSSLAEAFSNRKLEIVHRFEVSVHGRSLGDNSTVVDISFSSVTDSQNFYEKGHFVVISKFMPSPDIRTASIFNFHVLLTFPMRKIPMLQLRPSVDPYLSIVIIHSELKTIFQKPWCTDFCQQYTYARENIANLNKVLECNTHLKNNFVLPKHKNRVITNFLYYILPAFL